MSTASPQIPTARGPRYDLMAANLVIAVIAALLLAAVGSRVTVVQLLEKTEIAGIEVSLAVGAAVNPGVIVAAIAIFFAVSAAIFCTFHNRLQGHALAAVVAFCSWLFTGVAFVFFRRNPGADTVNAGRTGWGLTCIMPATSANQQEETAP